MRNSTQGLITAVSIFFGSASACALDVGQKAPLFQTETTQGNINLTDILKSKPVILAFYYAAFTPV